ncbi:MAG: glutamyl-tRNA synthetase, glutamyl-tRNA synthetase [Candidatus Taylorbacteria bacterium]|nr:glutamyl-tRNA synthetase, glutamyl-tRNA synthetase [Candidatus Taylorbacteria bacterium]
MTDKNIKVRFPPSPTGEWHFGNIRTFVFNYLFAKKNGGEIVMRFEDTDIARNKPGSDILQLELLKKMGMDFDEGPYYQSQRKDIYKNELQRLIDNGTAYEAEENQAGTGKLIRIKNPKKDIVWNDLIKGEITIASDSFKDEKGNFDFIIARSINDPLYHFTVVVDDWLMGITHVLRGEDHVTSTPRQMVIFEALGAPVPLFGHLPTILSSENKKKLGKRNGAIPVREYLDQTYLPDAILNMISLLGWNPGGDQEIFTRKELIEKFSLEKVQKSPAIFNASKLDWLNKEHMKLLGDEVFAKEIKDRLSKRFTNESIIEKLIPSIKERIVKWLDIDTMLEAGEFDFAFKSPSFDKQMLICDERMRKGTEVTDETVSNHLKNIVTKLETIPEEKFDAETVKTTLWDYATENGRGIVLWAMRIALSGREKSPDPFQISAIIGKTETTVRLTNASKL